MRHPWHYLRMWPLLVALTVSASALLGTSASWRAFVCDAGTNEIYPIDLGPTIAPESSSHVYIPSMSVINPDATQAFITSGETSATGPSISTWDLTTDPISPITDRTLSILSGEVALTPNGSNLYLTTEAGDIDILKASDLSFVASIPQFAFGTFTPTFIALSPNAPRGYVTANSTRVFVINTDTNTVSTTFFDLPSGTVAGSIAITPDGSEIYIGDGASENIFCITLNDGLIHTITGLSGATATNGIAVAPNGEFAYAVQIGAGSNVLTKIDTLTRTVISSFTIPSQLVLPSFVAITPDGAMACITDAGDVRSQQIAGQYVAFLNTATGASVTPPIQLSQESYSVLLGISITPDQAPTARFTYTIDKNSVTFNASTSSSPIGSIASYAWDFGDGQAIITTSPTVSHTYGDSGGTFMATLTVTNTGGTSSFVTYTGHLVSNNGGPSAVQSQQLTISPLGVASFKGEVYRDCKKRKVFLKAKWSKSQISNTRKFIIFARGKKIATVKALHKRKTIFKLHPQRFPLSITHEYRQYLDNKYSICVVDTNGHISLPTFIHVQR